MPLLKNPYRDTRATTLAGDGGSQFTDEQIQNYFKNPTTTPQKAMNDMLKYGVGTQRVADVMGENYNNQKLMDFAKTQGVTYDRIGEGEIPVPGSYKDTRAGILMGPGSDAFTQQDIVNLARSGNTPEHIMNEVIARGGSLEQVSSAMQGSGVPGDWSVDNLKAYTGTRGVDYGTVQDAPYEPKMTPLLKSVAQGSAKNAPFVKANFDEEKGTVAGRLRETLDPNNPLMARAASLAQQQAAKRGMLNSGMAASQGMAAMTDAGLQIATPDANAFNQFALTNAQQGNQSNQFNAGESNKMGMFNAGSLNDMRKTQMGIDTQFGLADKETENLKMRLNNEREIKNMDTESQMALQNSKNEAEASANYGSLTQTRLNIKAEHDANSALTPERRANIDAENEYIINQAASLNRFMNTDELDLDFTKPETPKAPASVPVENLATNPEASTPEVQSQAQTLAKRAEISPGQYDGTANIINQNGTKLSSIDIRTLNHANKLNNTTISPERVVTSQELIDKSKDPLFSSWYSYKAWKDSLEIVYDPDPMDGGPMMYLWPE